MRLSCYHEELFPLALLLTTLPSYNIQVYPTIGHIHAITNSDLRE